MSWGDSGGGGVGTNVGSPEAASGAQAVRDGGGPPNDEHGPRPGCLRTMVTLAVILLILGVIAFLAGFALDRI